MHEDGLQDHPVGATYTFPDWTYEGCGPQAALNVLNYYGYPLTINQVAPAMETFRVPFSSSIATAPDSLATGLQRLFNAVGDGKFVVRRISADTATEFADLARGQIAMGNRSSCS